MLGRLVGYLWGDLSREDVKKFGTLGVIFFLLIGSYWLLRTQKNAAFDAIVGYEYQPWAKMINLFCSMLIVLLYSKLIDVLGKKKLLISLATFFSVSFLAIAYLLEYSTLGFLNPVASPDRLFGWFVYFMIEWIGSTMVGCFWAFVSSTTSSESAKKGYPLIIAGSQVGSILGSTLSYNSSYFGNSLLFGVGALALGLIVPMVFVYLSVVPENAPKAASEGASDAAAKPKKPKTGMLEGLKILMTRPYIIGILAVSTLYEIINTILEFEMNMLAKQTYATKEAFASFNGMYGIFVNCLALVFALLGTSFLIRRFGLRFCLMLFPLLTGALILGVYVKPVLGMLVAACMLIKGLSYALNNPTKEMMYIPTSQDVRYKAKGWIDQFGARSSKGIGSYINNMFKASVGDLMLYGTLISLGLVGVWLAAAAFVGSRFNKLTENNEIVE